jgi:predicted O-methyltransferase YrrM
MEHFYKNLGENWFTYPNLYSSVVKKYDNNSHFVEVGTWKGMSASYMAVEIINSGKNIKFDCVDTWEYMDLQQDINESMFNNLYEIFLNNIEPVKQIVKPVRSISWEAASLYDDKSLDFVFIDAAHDYDSVVKDINAWLPKLKENGTLAGHDYRNAIGVKKAVDEIIGQNNITESEGCWIYSL